MAPDITSGSLQGTDTAAAVIQTFDTKNVGTLKTLTPSGVITDGNSGNNYSYTYTPVSTGTITTYAITFTSHTDSRIYNGSTSSSVAPDITAGSLQGTDTAGAVIQTFDTKNVGTLKTLTPSGLITDGNSGNNYSYTYTPANTGTITTYAITFTAHTDSK